LSLGFLLNACENSNQDNDSDSPSGNATIQGTVTTFTLSQMRPSLPPPRNAREFFAALGDLLVPPAMATVANVNVRIVGTDLETTTDANGYFILSGVPAGVRQLEFAYAGNLGTYSVGVPESGVVTLNDIHFSGQTITVGDVQIDQPEPTSASTGSGTSVTGM
jgi:hypothetical protein